MSRRDILASPHEDYDASTENGGERAREDGRLSVPGASAMSPDDEVVSQPLPDEALVVRGGVMELAVLETNAQTHYDEFGEYALSVYSLPDRSADEIALLASLPHAKIRVSTVGRLREAGYPVVPSPGPPGHADLELPHPPTEGDWRVLDALFDPPRPNPAGLPRDS